MSYKGHQQLWCKSGHYTTEPGDYEYEATKTCAICKQEIVFSNHVDDTNGEQEGRIEPVLATPTVYCTCSTCNVRHVSKHPTYEIPKNLYSLAKGNKMTNIKIRPGSVVANEKGFSFTWTSQINENSPFVVNRSKEIFYDAPTAKKEMRRFVAKSGNVEAAKFFEYTYNENLDGSKIQV
jgi:hypothetical protein